MNYDEIINKCVEDAVKSARKETRFEKAGENNGKAVGNLVLGINIDTDDLLNKIRDMILRQKVLETIDINRCEIYSISQNADIEEDVERTRQTGYMCRKCTGDYSITINYRKK